MGFVFQKGHSKRSAWWPRRFTSPAMRPPRRCLASSAPCPPQPSRRERQTVVSTTVPMSGYDHLLPDVSSMHHLMHEAFGPPDSVGAIGASVGAADRERSHLADLAEADMAHDAESELESTLVLMAAIQLRASGAA